ncbi:MAG: transporter [Thermoanaerobaculia bacterium]
MAPPIQRALFALGLSGFLVATPPMVSAQTNETTDTPPPGPIVTDRPTDSASPLLVPRHTFQLEAGYKFSRTGSDSGTIDAQVLPDLLARFGINKKVEARLVAAGWTFESGADDTETGFNDISLGAKIALADERDRRPQMALLVDVSLPVGHSDHTNEYVIPKVLFLGSNSLSDRIGLTYNVGPSFVTVDSNGGSDTNADLSYAVALSGSTGGPFSLFGELYGAFAFGSNRPSRHNFQAGTTILLNRRFQIDIRGGLGLVDNEPDWLVGAGLAFRIPH